MPQTISNNYGTLPSRLIKEGKAYVDEQTSEQIAQQKGTPTQPGVESPYRNRPIEESLALFEKMNSDESQGRFHGASCQDRHGKPQHALPRPDHVPRRACGRTTAPVPTWKAYPMYDFAHGTERLSSKESPTHSVHSSSCLTALFTICSSTG